MIYFLDGNQRVIKIVRSSAVISAIQTQELPEDNSLLRDYLSVRLKNDERLFNAQYMAIKSYGGNRNAFDLYRIASEIVPDNATEFMGVQVAPYELEGVVIEDLRPQNRPLNQTMSQVLEGSDWRLGYVADNLPNVTINFYYVSVKNALKKIQELTNVEMLFKVEISGNKITDKWVEVYHQLGNRTMKRFNYGTNALSVVRESSHDELYTALIGRGKGEEVGETEEGDATYGRKINFADVEWKKSAGKPVDKPKGQKYIELPSATAEHGIKLIDGRKVPRIGIVDFSETDDPEKLIQETYQELLVRARPKVLFKASVINTGDMLIGDTVTIHRHDLGFHYQARVRKVVRDRKNNNQTQVEIGDVVHTPSTKRQGQINSALNNVASDLENVRGEITEARSSADGKNTNFYGNVEPERKKVGDTWFRDHPSLTGESQILVWNGEAWELIMDTSETTKNADAIAEQQQEIEEAKQTADEAVGQINTAVANAGFTSLDETISSVQSISNQAQSNAQTAINNSIDALGDASTALTNAQTALNKADSVSGDIATINVAIDNLNGSLSLKADSSLVDTISQTVNNHSLAIDANSQGLALKANTTTVNALTGRVTTAETGISANATAIGLKASQSSVDTLTGTVNTLSGRVDVTAGQISSKVWNTDIQTAVDGIEVGGRNLIKESDPIYAWTGEHNVTSNAGAFVYMTSPHYPAMYQIEVRAIDDSVVGAEFGWQWSRSLRGKTVIIGKEWKKATAFLEEHLNIGLRVSGGLGRIELRHIKVERGNIATDWTPAPEDTTALINHVESELTQKHDSIEATVSSVRTDLTGTTTLLNTTRTTVSGHTSTIATLRTDVDGKATTQQFNTLTSTVNGTIQRVGNAEGKITQIETNVSGLQTTVASKANQSQVTQLANGLSSVVTDLSNLEIGGRNYFRNPVRTYNPYQVDGTLDSEGTLRVRKVGTGIMLAIGVQGWNPTDTGIYTLSGFMKINGIPVPKSKWQGNTINNQSGGVTHFKVDDETGYFEVTQKLSSWVIHANWIGLKANDIITFEKFMVEKGNKATDWTPAPEDTQSQITQLSDNINLRVTKGELLSQINIEAGRTLIQSDRLYLDVETTVFSGNAFIPSAAIESLSADKINTGELDAANVNIVNLNVNSLVGNTSEFVRSAWNGVNSSVNVDSLGVTTRNTTNTFYTRLRSGTIEFGDDLSTRVGTIGSMVRSGSDTIRGIGIFVDNRKEFGIAKQWSSGGPYEYLMRSAINERGLDIFASTRIHRTLNMDGNQVHHVNRIYFGDTLEGIFNLADHSLGLYTRNGVKLGIGSSGDLTTSVHIQSSITEVFTHLDVRGHTTLRNTLNMQKQRIDAVNKINMGDSVNGLTYTSSGYPALVGNFGVMLGYGDTSNFSIRVEVGNTVVRLYTGTFDLNGANQINPSDERLKRDIKETEIKSLNAIKSWRFVGYNWKDDELNTNVGRQLGLIAQETPDLATYDQENDRWSINASKQTMMNSHAIQQLALEHDTVAKVAESNEQKIHRMQQELSNANRKIEELERKLA